MNNSENDYLKYKYIATITALKTAIELNLDNKIKLLLAEKVIIAMENIHKSKYPKKKFNRPTRYRIINHVTRLVVAEKSAKY